MDLIRVGDKIISLDKIHRVLEEILKLRVSGLSQQEVAKQLGVDRTFISRLETMGEIRKGRRIAVLGFPIKNKAEIQRVLDEEGVEFHLIFTDAERWDYVRQKNGLDLFNSIMETIALVQTFDTVLVIGSNKRVKIFAGALDKDVISLEIGESPIAEDRYVDPEEVRNILRAIKGTGSTKK